MYSWESNFALPTAVSNAGAQGDSWLNKENISVCDNRKGGDVSHDSFTKKVMLMLLIPPPCFQLAIIDLFLFVGFQGEKSFVGANSSF